MTDPILETLETEVYRLRAAVKAHRDSFLKENAEGESRRHLASKVDFKLWKTLEDGQA